MCGGGGGGGRELQRLEIYVTLIPFKVVYNTQVHFTISTYIENYLIECSSVLLIIHAII